jgi:rhodanese-related sulfurtransferase
MIPDPLADVPQIDPTQAREMWERGEADLVDVREQHEWDLGHIDGIKFIPMGQLPWRWRELDPEKPLICVCRSGNRSNYAAAMLRQAGIEAANMSGGMLQWKAEGSPVTPPGIVESH